MAEILIATLSHTCVAGGAVGLQRVETREEDR